MEVSRNFLPKDDFLNKVRNLCKKNIILIFDECTSGFRQTNGGLQIIQSLPRYIGLENLLKWL